MEAYKIRVNSSRKQKYLLVTLSNINFKAESILYNVHCRFRKLGNCIIGRKCIEITAQPKVNKLFKSNPFELKAFIALLYEPKKVMQLKKFNLFLALIVAFHKILATSFKLYNSIYSFPTLSQTKLNYFNYKTVLIMFVFIKSTLEFELEYSNHFAASPTTFHFHNNNLEKIVPLLLQPIIQLLYVFVIVICSYLTTRYNCTTPMQYFVSKSQQLSVANWQA